MTRMLSVEISVCCVRLYLPTEGMGALKQFQSTTVLGRLSALSLTL